MFLWCLVGLLWVVTGILHYISKLYPVLLSKDGGKGTAEKDMILDTARKQFFARHFVENENTKKHILPFPHSAIVLQWYKSRGKNEKHWGQSVKLHKAIEVCSFQSSVQTGQHQFLSSGAFNSRKETPGIKYWCVKFTGNKGMLILVWNSWVAGDNVQQ